MFGFLKTPLQRDVSMPDIFSASIVMLDSFLGQIVLLDIFFPYLCPPPPLPPSNIKWCVPYLTIRSVHANTHLQNYIIVSTSLTIFKHITTLNIRGMLVKVIQETILKLLQLVTHANKTDLL